MYPPSGNAHKHQLLYRLQQILFCLTALAVALQPCTLLAASTAAPVRETLVLDPPALIAPTYGAVTTGADHPPLGVPRLEWQAVANAEKYIVEVSKSAGFATFDVKDTTYATTYTPIDTLVDGEYFWRVRAQKGSDLSPYSEVRSFLKDWSNGGLIVPQLISPPEGATRIAFGNDDFTWEPVLGAATYLFEISADQAFSNVIYFANTVKARHTPISRLPSNLYYWRVTPVDAKGYRGQPSAIQSFEFSWNLAPQLLSPTNNVDLAFVPDFAWTAVEAAKEYHLEISTQPDFGSVTLYKTANTAYTPVDALSNDQDYYWRVKAIDNNGNSTPWSTVNRFRVRWNFEPQLLTPVNSVIHQSHPFFSWTSIPGAETYRVQLDESTSFASPLMDQIFYNVNTGAVATLKESTVFIGQDYYWRVQGVDAQGNTTPWSDLNTFRYGTTASPNLVYPLPYYTPDMEHFPVYNDRTVAWPLFIWDTGHGFDVDGKPVSPDYYQLTVSADPNFSIENFTIETAGLGAAPTRDHQFNNIVDGQVYYWRVRAYLDDEQGSKQQLGADHVWKTRIDRTIPQMPTAQTITPIYPAEAFEAVGAPPVLGWLPVPGASNYRVEIARDPNFENVVEIAEPLFVNYVPWQGKKQGDKVDAMPFGAYWWRVRADSAPGVPLGDWSVARRFHLSLDLVTANEYDLKPKGYPDSILAADLKYDPQWSYIDTSTDQSFGDADIGDLHIMHGRLSVNLNWIIAFETSAIIEQPLQYGIYIDADHRPGSGGTTDPLGKPISVDTHFLPDYVVYLTRTDNQINPAHGTLYTWNSGRWSPPQTISAIGGDAWYAADTQAVQILLPYTAIGAGAENFPGSMAMLAFSTGISATSGISDSVPLQNDTTVHNLAFVSDMLMPLYPFDTPLSNPIIHYDVPVMRWRMPAYDSVDGYQLQIARDARFTDRLGSGKPFEWELYEKGDKSLYAFLSAIYQSGEAFEDNESYYWRVRVRHEQYTSTSTQYDPGPWSPPIRFKLDSREVGNPRLSTGALANTTPTFSWDRVEGAASYTIQVDVDANFSSSKKPVDAETDATNYTPEASLPDGNYFWRVAMRRSKDVIGHWTTPMPFVKKSVTPNLISPVNGVIINEQPTFQWSAILMPAGEPRVAAPQYRIQVSSDPEFGNTLIDETTTATTFTSSDRGNGRKSLPDGTWYWRVAVVDLNKKTGVFSAPQQFYKEYLAPVLLYPAQDSTSTTIPSFGWQPVPGAAEYEIEIDDDPNFGSPIVRPTKTRNTTYTPIVKMTVTAYSWRVRMIDKDGKPGPFKTGKVNSQTVSLSMGNYVWVDTNGDGSKGADEGPVADGVVVELLDGAGAALNKTATTQNGFYLFSGLNTGEYRVRLAASNFASGGLLANYGHSTGPGQEADPNANGDQNDNGLDSSDPVQNGILSSKVSLSSEEPTGEQPTPSGNPGVDGSGALDNESNLTVDFGVMPLQSTYSIGNFVGVDANNDGQIDKTASGNPNPAPNGILLELLDANGVPTGRTATTTNGYYLFSGLNAGDYRVRIAASNFAANGILVKYVHSTGNNQETDPNANGDQNDNGLDIGAPAVDGISSGMITLNNNMPLKETPTSNGAAGSDGRGTPDANSNLTVDFALVFVPGGGDPPTSFPNKLYIPLLLKR